MPFGLRFSWGSLELQRRLFVFPKLGVIWRHLGWFFFLSFPEWILVEYIKAIAAAVKEHHRVDFMPGLFQYRLVLNRSICNFRIYQCTYYLYLGNRWLLYFVIKHGLVMFHLIENQFYCSRLWVCNIKFTILSISILLPSVSKPKRAPRNWWHLCFMGKLYMGFSNFCVHSKPILSFHFPQTFF